MADLVRSVGIASASVVGAGAACVAYAAMYEVRNFAVRHVSVPVLAPGSAPIRALHLSDTHMLPGQRKKQRWLRSLAALEPDLVINTGDNFAHRDSLIPIIESYGELLDVPGVFVFGSNDYVDPRRRNPVTYLRGGTGEPRTVPAGASGAPRRIHRPRPSLPVEELRSEFLRRGWKDLNNRHARVHAAGRDLAFVGVDDPHLNYDELDDTPADSSADLAIAVAHAPYLRVLDRWNVLGYPLILAGHTHGGQLCVPFYGALVTNCDLDRRRAKGLHTHQVDDNVPSWMHVSAGLGTSPYAPVRFACRPEATLLTLTS